MKDLYCPACGGLLDAEPYRALDGTQWCVKCANWQADHAHENYAQEIEVGLVDLHAVVLDRLRLAAEMDSPDQLW
jgi:hypothetical protein